MRLYDFRLPVFESLKSHPGIDGLSAMSPGLNIGGDIGCE
jgi:hypothetical protein